MGLDNSELGPDEIDLEVKPDRIGDDDAWFEIRKYWNNHLKEWEANLYYPVFAKMGIPKGIAYLIYETRRGNHELNILSDYFTSDASDEEDGEKEWKKP